MGPGLKPDCGVLPSCLERETQADYEPVATVDDPSGLEPAVITVLGFPGPKFGPVGAAVHGKERRAESTVIYHNRCRLESCGLIKGGHLMCAD